MATAPNPYAAIARLKATQSKIPRWDPNWVAPEVQFDPENPFGNIQLPPTLKNAQGQDEFDDLSFVDVNNFTDLFSGDRGQFQSKFNQSQTHDDGTTSIRMQQPGGDKYDLMDVYYRADPATGDMVMTGDPKKFRQQSSNTEFGQGVGKVAAIVGGAALGPGLAGLLGGGILGGAGAGALIGAGGSALGGGNSQQNLRAGITGGIGGGIGGYFQSAPDAIGDYMRTGAAEGSTIGNAYTGAGGQAGAVGANSIAAQMAIPSDFDPNSLFRNMADPTKALEPLGDVFQMPGEMPPMTGGIQDLSNYSNEGLNYPAPTTPTATSMPPADFVGDSVEITGKRIPNYSNEGRNYPTPESTQGPGGSPVNSFVPPVAPAVPDGANYSNEGRNYPTPESTQGPGGSPINAAAPSNIPGQLFDLLKANPRLALSLLGSVGGKLFGGSEGPASPTGGISGLGQAGMTATQAPAFNRQYVAAPEGYRPGFSPQHKYFTGIGSVGMAPPNTAGTQQPNGMQIPDTYGTPGA